MIELYLLEYLVKFHEVGNLTKASEALFVSQPSLTRSMQKLESDLGITLFNHAKNKITFNEAGELLVQYAQNVLKAHDLMIDKMNDYKNSLSTISIGMVAPGPIFKYGSFLYTGFNQKNVVTSIKNEEELIDELYNEKQTIIFINHPSDDKNVVCKKCLEEKLFLSVPKNHFVAGMKNGIYFKDIDGQSFLMSNEIGSWNEIVKKHLLNSKFFLESNDNLKELVNSSIIPSFVTNITINNRLNSDRIYLPFLDEDATMPFYVAYLKKNESKVENFIQSIFKNNTP